MLAIEYEFSFSAIQLYVNFPHFMYRRAKNPRKLYVVHTIFMVKKENHQHIQQFLL